MQRRTFLKLVGFATVAAVLPAAGIVTATPAVLVATVGGRMYRAQGGLVSVSNDAGRTWRRHSNLGPDVTATRLEVVGSRTLRMTMRFASREFPLTLAPNGVNWLTV